MKTMVQKDNEGNVINSINVVEHIILRNFWEYYVTDNRYTKDIVRCLVMGYETELGDVSMGEIKPFIITKTKRLDDVMPASGWQWLEINEKDGE
jgi:hypothetical protein